MESLLKIDDTIQGNIYLFVGKTVPTKYICRSRKEIIKLLEKYWSSDNLLFTPRAMHISKGQLLTLNASYISTSHGWLPYQTRNGGKLDLLIEDRCFWACTKNLLANHHIYLSIYFFVVVIKFKKSFSFLPRKKTGWCIGAQILFGKN